MMGCIVGAAFTVPEARFANIDIRIGRAFYRPVSCLFFRFYLSGLTVVTSSSEC